MLKNKILKTIETRGLLKSGDHIVIGLSGGPDSVTMFDLLDRLSGQLKLTIHPVHVNHKFRPGAAERDQAYVEDLCQKRGWPCRSFVVDCNALAEETGMTSEEAGRKARYDAFYQVAQEVLAQINQEDQADTASVKIAVAQNANDQAETILFRLLRGTGTDGIAGIAYKRSERGITVIRPLLDIYRDEIEAYCENRKLNPVIDHTNQEAIYARNRIRLELLPYLQENYNENIMEGLVRLGRIASDDKDYIWHQVNEAFEQVRVTDPRDTKTIESGQAGRHSTVVLEREGLAAMHPAIRHRVVLRAFAITGLEQDVTAERLEGADKIIDKKQGPKTVEFPHGYKLHVAKGKVTIGRW